MIVMGIKGSGHDTGAAILREVRGGLNLVAVSEERLNRSKHSRQYPLMSIEYCLETFGLKSLADVDLVVFDWHHGEFNDEDYASSPTKRPESDHRPAFNHAIHNNLELHGTKSIFIHHLSAHAASAYYLSPFRDAGVLIVDYGVGMFSASKNDLTTHLLMGYGPIVEEGKATNRPLKMGTGMMFNSVTRQLGYDQFGAGKSMALASYANLYPKEDLLSVPANRHRSPFIDYSSTIREMHNSFPVFHQNEHHKGPEGILESQWVNLARQAQKLLEEDMIYLADETLKKANSKNLCLAGGVALSCVTNRKIYDSGVCENIFIQPAASDEGVSLGCALAGYYMHGGKIRAEMHHAYLGRANDKTKLEETLRNSGLPFRKTDDAEVAKLLADGKVIGRCFDGAEHGPRALGNRSILADPRRPYMTDVLNRRIKHRELFRPFAPSCHADKVERYFEMPIEGPFMIMAAPVKPEARNLVAAVVHIDGSCRPQTVRPDQNPAYYNLIEEFGKLSGVYCLINTSFNDNCEPIVETHHDAISSFLRTGLDHLYVDGYLVDRPENSAAIPASLTALPSQEENNERYEELARQFCDYDNFVTMRTRLQSRKAA